MPGAADGTSTKWGKVIEFVYKSTNSNNNSFTVASMLSQRNGGLTRDDFNWSNGYSTYTKALNSLAIKFK